MITTEKHKGRIMGYVKSSWKWYLIALVLLAGYKAIVGNNPAGKGSSGSGDRAQQICTKLLDAYGIRPTQGDPERQFAMNECLKNGEQGVIRAKKVEDVLSMPLSSKR